MADTKKEHYVPRCYLENFEDAEDRIWVYDKVLMDEPRHQLRINIGFENYFYDIDFNALMSKMDEEKQEAVKQDIKRITGIDDWDCITSTLLKPKYIEKEYMCKLEDLYGPFLKRLISKSYDGNDWVIRNCSPFSEDEKLILAVFLAVQIIRTKTYRDTLRQIIEKTYEALAYKQQMFDEDAIPRECFQVKADKDFVKLQHSSMLMDDDVIMGMAETLSKHIWVIYVNKTDQPFYTSDNPVCTIPHKFDQFISYGGFASEGVEVVFPISPNLLLAMYEEKWHSNMYTDRTFIPLDDRSIVDFYNKAQVVNSHRAIYSQKKNFDLAEKVCIEHPQVRDADNKVSVS